MHCVCTTPEERPGRTVSQLHKCLSTQTDDLCATSRRVPETVKRAVLPRTLRTFVARITASGMSGALRTHSLPHLSARATATCCTRTLT